MRKAFGLLAVLVVFAFAATLANGSICPTTGSTNTDCAFIITIGAGGSLSGSAVAGANAYDGSDDALIGVVNNSGAVFNGSFTLTGAGNGGGIFAFEGDGICLYVPAAYCSTAATGYEGPLNTFSNISTTTVASDTGTVNFTGLAAGATTFFSLESSPASIAAGGGIIIGPSTGVPEPASMGLLVAGLAGLCWKRRPRQT